MPTKWNKSQPKPKPKSEPKPDRTRTTKIVIGSVILSGLVDTYIYYMKKRPKKKRIIL